MNTMRGIILTQHGERITLALNGGDINRRKKNLPRVLALEEQTVCKK